MFASSWRILPRLFNQVLVILRCSKEVVNATVPFAPETNHPNQLFLFGLRTSFICWLCDGTSDASPEIYVYIDIHTCTYTYICLVNTRVQRTRHGHMCQVWLAGQRAWDYLRFPQTPSSPIRLLESKTKLTITYFTRALLVLLVLVLEHY